MWGSKRPLSGIYVHDFYSPLANEPAARLACRDQVAPLACRPRFDPPWRRRGKKISLAVLAARHSPCGYRSEFGGFFRGRRSRGHFLLTKYGGAVSPRPCFFYSPLENVEICTKSRLAKCRNVPQMKLLLEIWRVIHISLFPHYKVTKCTAQLLINK